MINEYNDLIEKIEIDRIKNVFFAEALYNNISNDNNEENNDDEVKLIEAHKYGLYWIYTDYLLEDVKNSNPSKHEKAIKINFLAKLHEDLPNICKIENEKFQLVYNGIAGPRTEKGKGVRERLLQHFGNGSANTGCIAIGSTNLNKLKKWKFSYAELTKNEYEKYSKDLERIWRLKYGWPLLCRR